MTKIRLLSILSIFVLLFSMISFSVYADEPKKNSSNMSDTMKIQTDNEQPTDKSVTEADAKTEIMDYASYLKKNGEISFDKVQNKIVVSDGESDLADDNTLAMEFTVPKEGYYTLSFQYKYNESANKEGKTSFLIDGKIPYKEAKNINLSRLWINEKEIKSDEQGNDISPEQIELHEWQNYVFYDNEGVISDPLLFYFSQGNHKLTFMTDTKALKFKGINLKSTVRLPSYEEYMAENSKVSKYNGNPIVIQGEDAKYKSEMYLIAQSDVKSAVTNPSSPDSIKLNTFGGANWKLAHEKATWIVNAPQEGLYKLNIRFNQNYNDGIRSYRRLIINDSVPFQEANALGFQYSDSWQSTFLGDYYIKLNGGENKIEFECVLGGSAEILSLLQKSVFDLNAVYRDIIMVTGTVPDDYRDYSLDVQIPDLVSRLSKVSESLTKIADIIQKDYGKNSTLIAQIRNVVRQLNDMAKTPSNISKSDRLSSFKDNISTTGSWISMFREQPLLIDALSFTGENEKPMPANTTFGQEVAYRFKRFVASFVKDYTSLGTTGENRTINVWLPSGRDQANVLKQIITSDFTPSTGIGVNLSLVTGSIIEATLAGKGPDVALSRGDTDAVNFAMRGALYDISKYSDFNSIKSDFAKGAFTPFQYKGRCYAVPETMSFNMMFCRMDVLNELGLKPPKTWKEMINLVYPVLSRNNLEIGVGNITDIQNMNGSNIFTNLLYQKGGKIYADDLKKTALDTRVAYEAFSDAVDMYSDYKFPQAYDAMTRFRSGEMPIEIAPYTNYNLYELAIPELDGLWEMYPIPGVQKDNGKIDTSQAAIQTSAMMFKNAKDTEACWEFLKWWVSEKTQANYGLKLEAILGPGGRYNTANLKAMSKLPWGKSQLTPMSTQIDSCVFIEQLPGSYFTSRAINNAFMTSIMQNKNKKEQLLYWNQQINMELKRKQTEFADD